jgi:hypothetical protein
MASQCTVTGVAQYRAVGTGRQHLCRCQSRLLEERRGVGILGRVELTIRIAVAREECLQSQHRRRIRTAHEHRAAGIGCDQAGASQDQGAHDPFAQVGLGDQQGA